MPRYAKVATREVFHARVLGEVRALPGVRAAGFISFLPLSGFRGGIWPVTLPGDTRPGAGVRGADNVAALRYVTPGAFAALGIPLLRGRDVAGSDTQTSPFVAVVSQSFAARYWPGVDPIGRHFQFAFADREVVGVAGDVKFRGLERRSEPQAYVPSRQVADEWITYYAPRALAVRAAGPLSVLGPAIRAIVHRADPEIAITEMQTLDQVVSGDTASRTTQVFVLGVFAGVAFLLAAVGLHGVLVFAVSQRSREIGVRVALGARPRDVVRMVAFHAARLGAAGLGVGLAAAYAAARSIESLLAGVRPGDAEAYGAAVALVGVMLVAGTLVPTLRALRVDPITAIRSE
jgi:putative ABC transport system permease protein